MPIEYPEPAYNPDTHAIEPDGEPKPSTSGTADGSAYVQNFVVVERPLADAKGNLKQRVAARRYEAEMGGLDWTDAEAVGTADASAPASAHATAEGTGTIRLPTDVESRTRFNTALAACPENATVNVKLGGAFSTMPRAELANLRDAIAAHVQTCFDHERELWSQIDACESIAALQAIDVNAGWPGGSEYRNGQ